MIVLDTRDYGYNPILLSIGDLVPFCLIYRIHSVFENAANFLYEDNLVSIVTPKIGAGPHRIVLNGMPLDTIERFELRKNELIVNGSIKIAFSDNLRYISTISFNNKPPKSIAGGITEIKKALISSDSESLILNLIKKKKHTGHKGLFDRICFAQMEQSYNLLMSGDIIDGALGFKGIGQGLTPAGDDFIIGLLIGLGIREIIEKVNITDIRKKIYQSTMGTSFLVNNFLLHAFSNRYDEKWKLLISSIRDGLDNIKSNTQIVLESGSTSGADTLTGFVSAWDIKKL